MFSLVADVKVGRLADSDGHATKRFKEGWPLPVPGTPGNLWETFKRNVGLFGKSLPSFVKDSL